MRCVIRIHEWEGNRMKRDNLMVSLIVSAMVCGARAQAVPDSAKSLWQKEMVASLQLSQTGFDNWAQGGENSAAWQAGLSFKFVRDAEQSTWSHSGKFAFGTTKAGKAGSKKSIDEIKLESVYTVKTGWAINPYAALSAETQFAPGYRYGNPDVEISNFLDPGYLRESLGLGYKPNEVVFTRLGASIKETLTRNFPAPYADDPGTVEIEKTKMEAGAESVTDVNWKLSSNALLKSKLELFSNLKAFDEIDVNWDNVLSANVTKYVTFNFNVRLLYDKTVSPKRQIMQALTVGFSYRFL